MTELVRNYGDPAAEYAAARDGAAIIDRADRVLLRAYGRDPLRMVQGLVTNDVAGAPADRAVYAALLTPKGRMLADMRIIRHGDELLLECDRAALDNMNATFRKFVPPLFARFEDLSEQYGVIGVHGVRCDDVVRTVLGEDALPASPHEDVLASFLLDGSAAYAVRTHYAGEHGIDIVVPRAHFADVWNRFEGAGARPFGHATLDVLRIEAGRPRWGAELTEQTIPLEADLLARAISTTKGCYTGQEVIVRILHRGHVNWHLRGVLLGDLPAPPSGAELVHPDTQKRVARITSVCSSPLHAQTIALAYARRELELPVEVQLADGGSGGGEAVTIVPLPFPVSDLGGPSDTGMAG